MSYRKRIRGMRRHCRNLRNNAERPITLRPVDIKWLTRFQRTSFNVTTDPWNEERKLPPLFRQLWVARLAKTFQQWHIELTFRYPAFYLALELYPPDELSTFRLSRVVARLGEQQSPDNIEDKIAGLKPLPTLYQAIPGITDLQWQAYERVAYYAHEVFAKHREWFADKAFQEGIAPDGEPCIIVSNGWCWIGQANIL